MKYIYIKTDFITLGQFLKYVGIVDFGAMAKIYLNNNDIYVNNVIEKKRGKKLYINDVIKIKNIDYIIKDKYEQ